VKPLRRGGHNLARGRQAKLKQPRLVVTAD
jgi:hypothetical protein